MEERLNNLLKTQYPAEVEILIGTDACTDATDALIAERALQDARLRHFRFPERQGKPNIINQLVAHSRHEILVLTDAGILFAPKTLEKLARHFLDQRVGLVNALEINRRNEAGQQPESSYLGLEGMIKHKEGLIFGAVIGANGPCYAMRKKLYRPTPPTFIVDDFYIGMQVLLQHKRCILDPEALAIRPPLRAAGKAFRRRVRISAGNFQNLFHFFLPSFRLKLGAGWCYLSHKVLRWCVPFFLIASYVLNIFLLAVHPLYILTLVGQTSLLALAALSAVLARHAPKMLKSIGHFYYMNLALLVGFIRYVRGIKSNAWNPTQRTATS
ncbi:MAG: glycosyltransferase [Bacteroidetes bacterium]|nr:glycosyltransferase [Bacteroidota bacterium]